MGAMDWDFGYRVCVLGMGVGMMKGREEGWVKGFRWLPQISRPWNLVIYLEWVFFFL